MNRVGSVLQAAVGSFTEAGYEVQTTRVATPAFPLRSEFSDPDRVVSYAVQIERAAVQNQIDYISIGPALPEYPDSYLVIPEIIKNTERLFVSGLMTSLEGAICLPCTRSCAQVIHSIAPLEPDGFANLRFAALAWVKPGAPFFPAAYADPGIGSESISISIATEAADLAIQSIIGAASLNEARQRLVTSVEANASRMSAVAAKLTNQFDCSFSGFDFTLAPFPDRDHSIGSALEALGIPQVGGAGTLAGVTFLAEALDHARFPRCGFNGLMLPVLEDAILARSTALGGLSVHDLLLYSSVCGTGLDTIPLPGDISVEALYALLLDVGMLSHRLAKPLTARLMPIPDKSAGDETTFDFPYFANSRVMNLEGEPLTGLLTGDETISILDRHAAARISSTGDIGRNRLWFQ